MTPRFRRGADRGQLWIYSQPPSGQIDARIQNARTEIYVYSYYRTDPPRLQWGFLNPQTGMAVVYDMEADLIATIFKPEEGVLLFERQIDAVKINRTEWNV